MAAEEGRDDTPREPTRRLFFALWPDEPMRQALAHATRDAARASGGRPVPEANLHVTLAFLGAVAQRQLPELACAARRAVEIPGAPPSRAEGSPGSAFELAFHRLEFWRAARLLCALPAEPPAWTVALARGLQQRLTESGFALDLKPFRPHVTVVRKVSRPGSVEMHPVVWRFMEVALIESRTLPEGPLYSVVESFPLCSCH